MKDAAEELGVTHGAISRQVRGLEDILGVILFEGPRNNLRLTEAALGLLPDLTYSFDRVEEAVNRVARQNDCVLDVSCLGTLSMRWLIPRLFSFQKQHPEIEVRLTSDDGPVDFSKEHIDVAIRVGNGSWSGIQFEPLFEDLVGPVFSPSILSADEITAKSDLQRLPFLHTKTRLTAWQDWCQKYGIELDTEGRVYEHFYFLLEATTAGLGAAIAPKVLVKDDVDASRLVAPFGFAPNGQTYFVLFRKSSRKQTLTFVAWLRQQAAAQQAHIKQMPGLNT
jgi:DNA-binding transcriptional LysR family regulator